MADRLSIIFNSYQKKSGGSTQWDPPHDRYTEYSYTQARGVETANTARIKANYDHELLNDAKRSIYIYSKDKPIETTQYAILDNVTVDFPEKVQTQYIETQEQQAQAAAEDKQQWVAFCQEIIRLYGDQYIIASPQPRNCLGIGVRMLKYTAASSGGMARAPQPDLADTLRELRRIIDEALTRLPAQ